MSNLEAPCGCTGTQRYAHKDCIQKWVNEKHHTTCEICEQQYRGSYVVPPAPPPQGESLSQGVAPLGSLYLTVQDDRMAGQLLADVYDDWDDHRQPTVSWCFSFMMFLLFMMFLHSTMTISVPTDPSSGGMPGDSGSSSGPGMDPSGSSSGPSLLPGDGGAVAGFAAGASLFLLWLLTKLFLVVLPLLMVMRLAQRAQEQAAEAAAAEAAGSVPGLDAPPAAAAAAMGSGSGGGGPYHGFLARLAGARGGGMGHGSSNSSSSITDLELEVLQARRAALSRLGRDPTFWTPGNGAAAAVPAPAAAGSGSSGVTIVEQQQEEQRMVAAIRAMVRAAIASAAQRELARRQQGGEAAGSSDAAGRLSGVV